jgi:isocitrate dehydrogenase
MPNLYGDILSDVAAQIAGSVGLAGSANIGQTCAMFEAIHGSAPRRAGQNLANPSGLLQGAVMMLNHIGQADVATRIQNAWLKTIEDGIHTYDIYQEGKSTKKVGTSEFADAVIANLGKSPERLKPVNFSSEKRVELKPYERKAPLKKELKGVDVFVHWRGTNPAELGEKVKQIASDELELSMITNRGIKVWPEGFEETFCTDHWRCRFKGKNGSTITHQHILQVLTSAAGHDIDTVKTENLYDFEGKPSYSLGQGQ